MVPRNGALRGENTLGGNMKIVCDDKIPFLRGVLEPYARVEYIKGSEFKRSDVLDADALIIRTRTRCDADLLEGTSVRFIATATIGYDHIDTLWCAQQGIAWANAPGCNSSSVRQWVGSVLETLSHKIDFDLKGKTLGIVGVGHVGSKVEELAGSLGMNVVLCDPPRAEKEGRGDFVDLKTLIHACDIITLHVPLDKSTFHLFDARTLSLLRPGQILLNSSRGEVVDGDALKDLLRTKQDIHAVLDVWEHEPAIDTELLKLVDIGTPHIAGYSADGKANGTSQAVRAVAGALGIKELADFKVTDIPQATEPSYDVLGDDARLRSRPQDFERLRSDYPLRREPLYRRW